MSILDRAKQLLSNVGQNVGTKLGSRLGSPTARPPFEKHYVLALCAVISYMIADLTVLSYRPSMLPREAQPIRPQKSTRIRQQSLAEYNIIEERNIFNEDGKIADALSATKGDENVDRPAVPSQLPIQLLGTIVHFNPKMSIATVNLSSKSLSSSYKVGEEIENMARITKIERKKVTFVNLNNRRNEYIEITEDAGLNFGMQTPAQAAPSNELIEQRGRFDFAIKRTDLDGLTQNLGSILQQARMEPVFSPDGISVEGFKFASIQPGSPFEKMGFKVGDMIKSVNGEPVNSPTKAMEMYNLLKASSNVQLGVDRDGREEKFNYTIQ
jgi:general secretion pathway protein C